jgi:hypothetical protein
MAWTAFPTWVVGQVSLASDWNTYVANNGAFLAYGSAEFNGVAPGVPALRKAGQLSGNYVTGGVSAVYTTPFPNAGFVGIGIHNTSGVVVYQILASSTTGFSIALYISASAQLANGSAYLVDWIAEGY